MFTHCRWKPFQNHLPSGCRYCRLTSDIHDIYVFTQEFFTGSPDMLPILKTPNISTISTYQPELEELPGGLHAIKNSLWLNKAFCRHADIVVVSWKCQIFDILEPPAFQKYTLVVWNTLSLSLSGQKKTNKGSCDWKFSRVDMGNLTRVDPILCFPILAYDHIAFLQ